MDIKTYLTSSDDLENVFLEHRNVHAVIYLPKGMQNTIMKGESASLVFYTNSSNIVFGNILKKEAFTLTNTVMAGAIMQRLKIQGLTYEESIARIFPIKTEVKSLYNPSYNYLYYLVPGLMTVLLQMIMFFAGAKAINSEWNEDGFSSLYQTANGSILSVITGKLIAYTVIGLLITLFIFGVIFGIFQIPFMGNYWHLFILFLIFIVSNILLGMAVSAFFNDEVMAMDIAFFYNSPAFVFSGFTFPIFAMPAFSQWYAQIIPYTHFLDGFFKIYQMNVPFEYVIPEITNLLIFVLVGLVATIVGVYLKMQKVEQSKMATTRNFGRP
jgi:ABC-2 type transport system permease protein